MIPISPNVLEIQKITVGKKDIITIIKISKGLLLNCVNIDEQEQQAF